MDVGKYINPFRLSIEHILSKLGLGMRTKLIIIFVVIKVIPLLLLTFMAWRQSRILGEELNSRTMELALGANEALTRTGTIAVNNSVEALNSSATDNIERMSTDMARRVAEFLYARDRDILAASELPPEYETYRRFIKNRTGPLIKPGEWKLAEDGRSWVPVNPPSGGKEVFSSNRENDSNFHYRPPDTFEYEERPLFLEITYVDLEGNELIKAVTSPRMNGALKNVSDRRNTYVRAETYWPELLKLKPGEIYVSDVIGAYVKSRLIGMYTPENAAARGLEFKPREEAYAGKENPLGKRFRGIIRWAAPVTENGSITGYVTLALDHDHLMEFTDHSTPMNERYTELPSAYEGNYAFIWDYKCRNICHPRHHSIVGYNPETGEPEVPWLEESIYNAWQESGRSFTGFIRDQPVFAEQSRDKKPAAALTGAGLVGLDGRYLNHAPQCTGWFDLTREGGSGSFLILWSGLWKLTTAATIPYYTGHYGQSKRGFGFVAIGAGFEDFERPARETEAVLKEEISSANRSLIESAADTQRAIADNLWNTTAKLAVSAGLMIILVVLIAIWMASIFTRSITRMIAGISRFRSGERHFRFNTPVKDEMGILADSFDDMADSLVASDRGPLVITGMDGRIIYVNDAGLLAFGKSTEDLQAVLGRSYNDLSIYPPGSVYDPIAALKEGRETDIFYERKMNCYFKGSAACLTSKEGKNIGYIITSTDVSEIIEDQKATAEQKALLDTIFTASPDLIWYQNAQGRLLAVNPRYAALFGKNPNELTGLNVEQVIPPEYLASVGENNRKAVELRRPYYVEEKLSFADGHKETLDTVITPIFDTEGDLAGILGFGRDVSARVSIENKLRKTQLELEGAVREANEANQHKGDFLARMSHEIRTPMNAIIGMTNIVKKQTGELNAPEEIKANLSQIEASSQHLLGLLNDILDISKIEAGKIELNQETVDMMKLAGTVVSMIRPRCEEKNIAFNTRFAIPPPAFFTGDSLRIRQVLINLLGNAVKFTPECGSIDFVIEQRESRDGRALLFFSVKDSGIGIPKESMALLFRPFEQTSDKISKRYGGTGLGLAISQSIVQLFGGEIAVQSRPGEGSVFSFEIRLPEIAGGEEETAVPEDAAGRLTGRRALLVDDVAINRIIAINLLEYTGLAIDEAGGGLTALNMFQNSPEYAYDIIYMDIQMPDMDGYETAAAIRALDRKDAKTIPIVALTANAFKEDIDKALANGMNAHLAKPMEPDKTLEITFKLLGVKEEA
ncbi:MAG: PAS domain-containing protein [Treponema sp.]|jgi:PAS domain S-box-containing protein|nr:PAS domain-containing protein [Treponema sp.]